MIGIDIIQISRIAEKIKNDSFIKGCFTEYEIAYYKDKGGRAETLAGFFAAKEAVAKALGLGFSGFRPTDIEVTHSDSGAPQIVLHNEAKRLARNTRVHISISHDGGIAAAAAMLKD